VRTLAIQDRFEALIFM